MEWDTAAGEAVLRAAGGVPRPRQDGRFLRQRENGLRNGAFIAWGDASGREAIGKLKSARPVSRLVNQFRSAAARRRRM